MTILTGLCLLVMSLNFVLFAWSVRGVFKSVPNQDAKAYLLLRVSSVLTWIVSLWSFPYSDAVSTITALCGLILFVSALSLYLYAVATIKSKKFTIVFSTDTPEFVEQSGPYRWIRHPFYTSYLLCYFAVIVMNQSWINVAAFVIMAAIYISAARKEEQKFANSDLKDSYSRYVDQTGQFFPRLRIIKQSKVA